MDHIHCLILYSRNTTVTFYSLAKKHTNSSKNIGSKRKRTSRVVRLGSSRMRVKYRKCVSFKNKINNEYEKYNAHKLDISLMDRLMKYVNFSIKT